MVKLIIPALAVVCVACTTPRGGSFCDIAEPQRPSAEERAAMSPERKREVLAHNLKGQKLCGWDP